LIYAIQYVDHKVDNGASAQSVSTDDHPPLVQQRQHDVGANASDGMTALRRFSSCRGRLDPQPAPDQRARLLADRQLHLQRDLRSGRRGDRGHPNGAGDLQQRQRPAGCPECQGKRAGTSNRMKWKRSCTASATNALLRSRGARRAEGSGLPSTARPARSS